MRESGRIPFPRGGARRPPPSFPTQAAPRNSGAGASRFLRRRTSSGRTGAAISHFKGGGARDNARSQLILPPSAKISLQCPTSPLPSRHALPCAPRPNISQRRGRCPRSRDARPAPASRAPGAGEVKYCMNNLLPCSPAAPRRLPVPVPALGTYSSSSFTPITPPLPSPPSPRSLSCATAPMPSSTPPTSRGAGPPSTRPPAAASSRSRGGATAS